MIFVKPLEQYLAHSKHYINVYYMSCDLRVYQSFHDKTVKVFMSLFYN